MCSARGRAAEVERLGDGDEIAQVAQLHWHSMIPPKVLTNADIMYWTVSRHRAGPADPIAVAHDPTRPAALAYAALVLTAALWGSSAVVARGLLDGAAAGHARMAALGRRARAACCRSSGATAPRDRRGAARRLPRARAVRLLGFAPQTCLVYFGLAGTTATPRPAQFGDPGDDRRDRSRCVHAPPPERARAVGLALSSLGVRVILAHGDLRALLCAARSTRPTCCCWPRCASGRSTRSSCRRAPRRCRCPRSVRRRAARPRAHRAVAACGRRDARLRRDADRRRRWPGILYIGALPTLVAIAAVRLRRRARRRRCRRASSRTSCRCSRRVFAAAVHRRAAACRSTPRASRSSPAARCCVVCAPAPVLSSLPARRRAQASPPRRKSPSPRRSSAMALQPPLQTHHPGRRPLAQPRDAARRRLRRRRFRQADRRRGQRPLAR